SILYRIVGFEAAYVLSEMSSILDDVRVSIAWRASGEDEFDVRSSESWCSISFLRKFPLVR
ncbi:MAG: hypothetical protein ACT4QE_07545, partial [Anaerolineales bacterium]